MKPAGATPRIAPDRRDLEIKRLKEQLAEARAREVRIRTEERERFSVLSAASKRFAASMRSRMDERQRTQRRLDAQYAVGRILEESRDFPQAAPQVFRVLAERLGWKAGVLWALEEGALRCRGVWRLRDLPPDGAPSGGFEEACRRAVFPRGAGLPGRVWAREEACWVEDVLEDGGYPHGEAATAEGLRCALAFPIRGGGRLAGVFELLREEKGPVEDDALRVVYLLGQQIGQFVERRRAEEERDRLRRLAEEGRARLSAVLQQMPDGVFIAEPGGSISLANEGATGIYGREIRSIDECGRYSLSYPDGEPIPRGDHPLDRALAGDTVSTEHFVERADGARGIVSANAAPVVDEEGRVVAAVEAFQDVTELVEARKTVEDRERRYRTLTTNIPGAVFRAAVGDGRPSMQFVSDRIEEITGYPAADFISDRVRNYRDVIHPEDSPNNEREVWRALGAGEPYNIEYRIVRADGGVRWVNERGSGTFAGDGDLLWVDGAIFDVTGRKRAEEEVRRTAERDAFRVVLADALRMLTDPDEIEAEAVRVLGEHLGANRAGFAAAAGGYATVRREYRDGVPPLVGHYRMDDFGPDVVEKARSGRTVVAADTGALPVGEEEWAGYAAISAQAYVTVPLLKDGRLSAFLFVFQSVPREWTTDEVALVEETAERTWTAVERARAEAVVRESEARLQVALHAMRAGIAEVDVATDHVTFDERTREILGADGGFTLAEGLRRYVHPEDRARVKGDITDALAGEHGGRFAQTWRRPHADGRTGWIHLAGQVLFEGEADTRRPARLVSALVDVTEQEAAEAALRASEERYRRLFDSIDEGFCIIERVEGGAPDFLYIEANPALTTQSGLDDVVGRTIRQVIPGEAEEWIDTFENIIRTGESLRFERGLLSRGRVLELYAFRVEDETRRRVAVIFKDVTASKKVEEALRENEAWLGIAQTAARSGSWEWDLANDEIRWSDEHRALFGFDPQTPVTREGWWAAVHPEDLPRIEEAGRRCFEEGGEWPEIEYRIRVAGRTRWIDARGHTVRDEGGRPTRILGISMDATARKEAEEVRDRLLAREWVAGAEAAERERISRELHDRVAHSMAVAHQSLQLHGFIAKTDARRAESKLDLAREMVKASLESTRNLSAELRSLDAEEGLEAELRYLLDVAVPPHVEAELHVEGDEAGVPGHVRGQLFLILREAVRNAVSHSGCGSLSVGLDIAPERVVGSVEDDGRGFEAHAGAVGVGLRSMRERAVLLDGALRLDCEPGRGTRVEVSVPLAGRS